MKKMITYRNVATPILKIIKHIENYKAMALHLKETIIVLIFLISKNIKALCTRTKIKCMIIYNL